MIEYIISTIVIIFILLLFSTFKIINQYERGVRFTLGKYSGLMTPGLNILIPIFQTMVKVDIRQMTIDLPPQDVMTEDKVNLRIDGLVFYTIEQPEKAVLNVKDLKYQLTGKATSELKEILGKMTMSESLNQRDKISEELLKQLNKAIKDEHGGKDWGLNIRAVQINNIELPKELVRAMSKQAEAEREKEARVTKAQGELEASKKFKEASNMFNGNPIALRLRELQTYQEIGTEHNTLMMVIPETMVNSNSNWLLAAGLNEAKKKMKD